MLLYLVEPSGFVECFGGDAALATQISANPYVVNPTTAASPALLRR